MKIKHLKFFKINLIKQSLFYHDYGNPPTQEAPLATMSLTAANVVYNLRPWKPFDTDDLLLPIDFNRFKSTGND